MWVFEGKQACNALAILKNWCDKIDLFLGTNLTARNPYEKKTISTTNDEGVYLFDVSLSESKAHQISLVGFDPSNFLFLNGTEQSILNGDLSKEIDFPIIPLKSVVMLYQDTAKGISSEKKTSGVVTHKLATNYYPLTPFEFIQKADGQLTKQITASIKMPHGWNFVKGTSVRNDGSTYVFVDSFFVEFNNSNQIWNLKY